MYAVRRRWPTSQPCAAVTLRNTHALTKHLSRSTGRPELEGQLSVIVSQYRRLLSTCIVRAQAQCLISRVAVISRQAREAARRREVAGRLERQLMVGCHRSLTDWQTLKDRATQLLIKYKSGTLLTQFLFSSNNYSVTWCTYHISKLPISKCCSWPLYFLLI